MAGAWAWAGAHARRQPQPPPPPTSHLPSKIWHTSAATISSLTTPSWRFHRVDSSTSATVPPSAGSPRRARAADGGPDPAGTGRASTPRRPPTPSRPPRVCRDQVT